MGLLGYAFLKNWNVYIPVYSDIYGTSDVVSKGAKLSLDSVDNISGELSNLGFYKVGSSDYYISNANFKKIDILASIESVSGELVSPLYFKANRWDSPETETVFYTFSKPSVTPISFSPSSAKNPTTIYFLICRDNSGYYRVITTASNAALYAPNGSNVTSNTISSVIKIYSTIPPSNFYHCSEVGVPFEGNVKLERGQSSSQLKFTAVYPDGTFELYPGAVEYSGEGLGTAYTIENNIITVAEHTTRPEALITAKPVDYPTLFTFITLEITNPEGPYDPGGSSGPGGGGGNFGDGDSANPVGNVPNGSAELDVTDSGLFSMYACSESDLVTLGAALYTEDILAAIGKEIMSFLWNSPIEGVIGLCSYPFTIPAGASKNLKFGALELPIQMNGVDRSFMQINWGTISLNEYWGNFLDYGPHTKIDLYLPWGVGFVPIDPHECLPGTLSVVTNIELAKGTCVHIVSGNIGQIGIYSGVCGSMLPVTAIDTSGKLLSGVTSAVTALVSAGAGAVAGSHERAAAKWIGASQNAQSLGYAKEAINYGNKKAEVEMAAAAPYQALSNRYAQAALASSVAAFRTPAQVQRNGGFSNSGAGLGIQNPFVIISRPEQNIPDNYGHYFGYPSNISEYLGNLDGYTEVADVHLTGISATLNELDEIESLLKGGVVL